MGFFKSAPKPDPEIQRLNQERADELARLKEEETKRKLALEEKDREERLARQRKLRGSASLLAAGFTGFGLGTEKPTRTSIIA